MLFRVAVTLTAVVAFCTCAQATTINVKADGSGDYPTIQAALDAAAAGDEVVLADGVYKGTGNKDLDFKGTAIAVRSSSGNAAACVIDCEAAGRGFYFHTAETAAASLSGVTIRNGKAADGAGIAIAAAGPTISSCVVSGCTATNNGGGVNIVSGSPVINGCQVSGNSAVKGGGIYNAGAATIFNCTVSVNTASTYGGGLAGNGTVAVIQCTVSGNKATNNGGGIRVEGGTWTIRQCTVIANRADAVGGGISRTGGTVPLYNSLVALNTAGTSAPDVDGTFDAGSHHNLVGVLDGSTGLTATVLTGTAVAPVNPRICLLGNNGGSILTHGLLAGSPALDAGDSAAAVDPAGQPLTTDQRGGTFGRITGAAVDIGATEGSITPSFALTGPAGIDVPAGAITPITWNQAGLPAGTTVRLYYDADNIPGNEIWIDVDVKATAANGTYAWSPVLVREGYYYVGGDVIDPATGQVLLTNRLAQPVHVTYAGTVYMVDSLDDVVANDGVTTLREALMAANTHSGQGDAPPGSDVNINVIRFADSLKGGTINLSGFELPIGENVWIQGPGSDQLTIDAKGLTRVFNIGGGSGKQVWITGLKLVNGNVGGQGGGIWSNSPLTLDDVIVAGCRSGGYDGAGIWCSGNLTARTCTISGNSGSGRGGIYCDGQISLTATSILSNSNGGLWCNGGTITNGIISGNSGSSGTGIYQNGGSLTIADTQISGNGGNSLNGGGIYKNSGSLALTRVKISGNWSEAYYGGGYGGGIHNNSGSVSISNSEISSNWARYYGGGILNNSGSVTIDGSTISGNSQYQDGCLGGGIYNHGTLTVRTTSIASNWGAGYGGGVGNDGTLTIENSTLSGNTAGNLGGSLYGTGSAILVQSTISGNSAPNGGGIRADNGTWTIRQCTIANNSASSGEGGGISQTGAGVTLYNSLVAGNTATGAGQDVRGSFSTASQYNLIGIVNDSIGLGDDPHTRAGTLQTPLDARLGALGPNEGATMTHALLPSSPAMDVGAAALALDSNGHPLTCDQRGPGCPRVTGSGIDIGATEGSQAVNFRLLDGPVGKIKPGSAVTIKWSQGAVPVNSTINLYADPDGIMNGNEFCILANADVDSFSSGYTWCAIGLMDLTANYTLTATLRTPDGQVYQDRLASSFQISLEGCVVYTVDSLADVVASDHQLTLREALQACNTHTTQGDAPPGSDVNMNVIRFADSLKGGTINLSGFELPINENVWIQGPGSGQLTVDAKGLTRVLDIGGGAGKQVWISGLNLVHGNAGNSQSGGIYSSSPLTLDDVTVANCQSNYEGAGIYCTSSLTGRNCTISDNSSNYGYRGGIYCDGQISLTTTSILGNSSGGLWCNDGTITGCTISGNSGSSGTGIYQNSGSLTITDTQISGNGGSTLNGGGIYKNSGSLALTRVKISGNWAENFYGGGYGGGIHNNSGSVSISNSEISSNWARYYGGGIHNSSGSMTIDGSTISGNSQYQDGYLGGGIYNHGTLTVRTTSIASNWGAGYGGGIGNDGTLTIENSTLSGNTAGNLGGGLHGTGNATLVQSTLSGNSAPNGGGIRADNGTWTIRQCTIANNTASSGEGGGIGRTGGTVTLYNTLVAGNTATGAGQDVRGSFSTASQYNLIGIVNDAIGLGDDPHTLAGTLDEPLDARLSELGYHDSDCVPAHKHPTMTHILLGDSPARNAGSDVLAVGASGKPLPLDQRQADHPRILGSNVDIGAIEGDEPVGFHLVNGPTGSVSAGSQVTITWTQDSTPMGSFLDLYVDTDDTINGNEFWIVRGADVDLLPLGYTWTVAGLTDPNANYVLGAVLYGSDGQIYEDRLSSPFHVVFDQNIYVVNSLADVVASDGQLTLREVLQAINLHTRQGDALPGSSTRMNIIRFSPALTGGTISLSGFELAINENVWIQGPGTGLLTIDAKGLTRVLDIGGGAGKQVWITGLKVVNGNVSSQGSGIWSNSPLTLDDVTVASCHTNGGYDGAGIWCSSNLTTRNCTISDNTSPGGRGGIYCTGLADLTATSILRNSYGGLWCNGGSIANCTISGNSNGTGAGIYQNSGTMGITDTQITGNGTGGDGGGIYKAGGRLDLVRVTLSGNWCASGGAINNAGGWVTLTNVTVSGNSASYYSGGLYNNGSLTLDSCTVTGNSQGSGGYWGGGIFNTGSGTLTVRTTSIASNSAGGYGGGIGNQGTLTLENSTLSNNTAGNSGGGLYDTGNATLVQSTFSGNRAPNSGGIRADGGTWTIRQCTIANNTASSGEGGGIQRSGGTVTLYNTIVAGNSATVAGKDVRGTFSTASQYNLIGIVSDSTGLGDDFHTLAGTLAAPLDANLEPLASNGGLTTTQRPRPMSPAINAGQNSLAVSAAGKPLQYDQRGTGAARIVADLVDIGAVEYQAQAGDNVPPTVGGLNLSSPTIHLGESVTLSATGVSDDHTVNHVSFYRDANNNGTADPDELLGTDTNGADGWSWSVVANWAPGMSTFLAVATDDGYPVGSPLNSQPASAIGTVLATDVPRITVGAVSLRTGRTDQRIPIYVAGLDRVTGFNFTAMLGNGSAGGAEPLFVSVDYTGSIWAGTSCLTGGGPVPGQTMYFDGTIAVAASGVDVQASGLLMTLVIDTRNLPAGQTYDLKLTGTGAPNEPQFLLRNGQTITPVITNGSVRLFNTTVAGRYTFYNNSAFDGNNAAANAADDGAIATDKVALLASGAATPANYTSYTKGLNGIMIDMQGLQSAPNLADFELRTGNNADPRTWAAAPAPSNLTFRVGAGTAGSDRISLTWVDGAIVNQWLQVRVKKDNTGLDTDDVFYFGNAIGECGNSTSNTFVDGTDMAAARDNFTYFTNPATILNKYDYGRDRYVNGIDMTQARDNQTNFLNCLQLIAPSQTVSMAMAQAASEGVAPLFAGPQSTVVTIDVGTIQLVANRGSQRVQIRASSQGSDVPQVSGLNLRAQIVDTGATGHQPVFAGIDYSGAIWETYPVLTAGGVIAGHPQYAQAAVLFSQTGQYVTPAGVVATVTIDTTGCAAGQTFALKMANTDIGQNSDLILIGDQTVEPTIVNGTIEIIGRFTGDINGDRYVDAMDLLRLANSWGKAAGQVGFAADCDLNGDGSVDVVDLLWLAGDWGR